MKGKVTSEIIRDSNDVNLLVTGVGLFEALPHTQILDVSKLKGSPAAVKLTDVFFAVQKGVTLFLWWDDGEKDTLIIPIVEGQGKLDLNSFGGLHNPKRNDWTGHVELSAEFSGEGEKNFTLVLGFAKVRE